MKKKPSYQELEKELIILREAVQLADESASKFKELANLTFEGVIIHNKGITIDLNDSFSKMFGYHRNELIGRNGPLLLFPKKYHDTIAQSINKSEVLPYEIEGIKKDGSLFPVEIEARNFVTKDNTVLRVAAVRDISERKKVIHKNNNLSKVIDQSGSTVLITDTDGKIEYVNKKFTEVTGYSEQEVIGKKPNFLNSGKQHNENFSKMWETIENGEVSKGHFLNKDKNERYYWEYQVNTPIKDESGKIINYLSTGENITDLKESELRLKTLFEYSPNPIIFKDGQGKWIESNKAGLEMFNLNNVDYFGKTDKELAVYTDDYKEELLEFEKNDEIVWQSKKELKTEKKIQLKNGTFKILEISKVPLFYDDDSRKGIILITNDITELKLAETELKNQNNELRQISNELSLKNKLLLETKNKYRNLFEQSPVSLWEEDFTEVKVILQRKMNEVDDLRKYLDTNQDFVKECTAKIKILNVNKVTLDLFKVSSIEELRSLLRNTNTHKSYEVIKNELISIVSKNKEFSDETEFITASGNKITTIIKSVVIGDEGKTIASIIDITALKKAEQELIQAKDFAEESEKKFRELYEKSGDAILILKNDIIKDCNQSTIKMFGSKSKKFFLNVHPSQISSKFQSDGTPSYEKSEVMIRTALKEGTHRFEWTHKKKNGQKFPSEILLTAILNEPNNYIVHAVVRDITKRKKAELQILEAKEEAEKSSALKTEFLNNMSHEIRTPMSGILSFSEFLGDPELTKDKRRTFVKIIQNSAKQLLQVIDDILEISKLGTNQVKVQKKEICLNNLLLDLFAIFDIRAKELKLPLYLENGLNDKECRILTDETKLNKIVSNLLENALKFTQKGFVKFGYQLVDNKLVIFVEDTGIGINKEKHNLIFERFSQAEKDLSKKVGGLGLGLSIAKENTELLGGEIRVDSEPNKGAKFSVTIPYQPTNNNSKIIENKCLKSKKIKSTILIAEDEEVNYLVIEILLKDKLKLDCHLIHAKNGQEAVDICKNNKEIDFVLMDIKMPVMNGYEATKQIKKIRPDLAVIAQTAFSTIEDKEKAFSSGCNDFISKPINKDTLKTIVDRILINIS